MEEGQNVCRIVSEIIPRVVTYKDGEQAQKYTCFVIDRKDGEIRMADFGKLVMKQLKALASTKDYAFDNLPNYDLIIIKSGSGFDTTYTLTPARQDSPLTPEEQVKINAAGSIQDAINKKSDATISASEIPF